jgi:hypothetical protein
MNTKTERRYEALLMALAPEERLAMAGDMLASARELVVAGMSTDQTADPRLVRRQIFLSFYGNDFAPSKRERILAFLDCHAASLERVIEDPPDVALGG